MHQSVHHNRASSTDLSKDQSGHYVFSALAKTLATWWLNVRQISAASAGARIFLSWTPCFPGNPLFTHIGHAGNMTRSQSQVTNEAMLAKQGRSSVSDTGAHFTLLLCCMFLGIPERSSLCVCFL
ncbi:hypothetical protein WMY93_026916 [Mugilogobius chulae]|uniref:CRIB domain-containing protein n=1 Tax=Mugilogobius chulae TaxID=88201 RepID=A0AAW0MRG1_9GOBI